MKKKEKLRKEKEKLLIEFVRSMPHDLFVWRDTMLRHIEPFLNKEISSEIDKYIIRRRKVLAAATAKDNVA